MCNFFFKRVVILDFFRSISEPYVFTNANFTFSYKKLGLNLEDVTKALVLLQCKPNLKSPFDRVFIKPCITSTSMVRKS